jgi:tight adherence protein C
MSATAILFALGASLVMVLLCVLAAVVIAQMAEDRDLSARIREVVHADGHAKRAVRAPGLTLFASAFRQVGNAVRRSTLFSERDILDIERALAASGQDPASVGSIFLGVKVVLLLGTPAITLAYALTTGKSFIHGLLWLMGGALLGIYFPNLGLSWLRKRFMKALNRGLPDALDLLVVCAEAGLGLESAVNRVARELQSSNGPTALEFATLSQELRMLPDRAEAFRRLGERTALDGFRRLGLALAQTLKYGTPLGKALRILAVEMRQERMLRIEDKAARLPALLVMPLIVFIMPALFIVLIGQSLVDLGAALK